MQLLRGRTGSCHLELSMVLNEILKLSLVFGGEIIHRLDVFLFAVILVAAEPLASNKHHADPGQVRRSGKFHNIDGMGNAPRGPEYLTRPAAFRVAI
jgi:hypothetical protein